MSGLIQRELAKLGHIAGYLITTFIVIAAFTLTVFNSFTQADPLPASFDLRNVSGHNYVTSVKDQSGGTCWTHGTMASIESNLLVNMNWYMSGESGEPNLAEYHLDWWNGFNENYNQDIYPPDGSGLVVHQGGDYLVAAAYLSRGEGAVRDIDGQLYLEPPARFDTSYHYFYPRHIEWFTMDDTLGGIDAIKERIMTCGAIGTCMMASQFIIDNIHYQPPSSTLDPNHAVTIIGWDDNKVTQAPQPGAWLVKNSWGEYWGEWGYFWISYYDKHSARHPEMGAVSFRDVEAMQYDKVYYHDYHGWRDTKTDISEAFNVFKGRGVEGNFDEELSAVSFYTATDNVTYTIKIYGTFDNGQLQDEIMSQTGLIERKGFHTIDLPETPDIVEGQYFYVYLNLSDGGQAIDRTSVVPVLLGLKYNTLVESSAHAGESYYYEDGLWQDLYDSGDSLAHTMNFCIKALTKYAPFKLLFDFPSGQPEYLQPEYPLTFNVKVENNALHYDPPTGKLHYRYHGGAFSSVPMVSLGSDLFSATLPATSCGAEPEYYFSFGTFEGDTVYYPKRAPETFLSALVGSLSVNIMDDNFESDQGWTVYGDATDGQWDRGVPAGGGDRGDPASDFDGSGSCFLTDNVDGNSDVDFGTTQLLSPIFDLTNMDARISYARWFCNNYTGSPDDTMKVFISNDNGISWKLVEKVGPDYEYSSGGWEEHVFYVSQFTTGTSAMRVRFEVSDLGSSSCVEAGIDAFNVTRFMCGESCCTGMTGNINCSTEGENPDIPDMSDIVRLIDYLYLSKDPLCCPEEADCNGDHAPEPDMSDIVRLIDYLYLSHDPIAGCE